MPEMPEMSPARAWLLATAVAGLLPGAFPCSTPAVLVDATAELHMHGRQARGVVTILGSAGGCRFQLSRFELAPGGELEWLGSDQTDVARVNGRTPKASSGRVGAGSYNNSGAVDTFRLTGDWSAIAMLVLWDVILERPVASAVLQKLRPGAEQVRALAPTMMDNCYALTPDLRVRWSLVGGGGADESFVDIGLEGKFPSGGYMAFGPCEPTSTSRQMVGSDVVVAGYHPGSNGFAVDSYISAVQECTFCTVSRDSLPPHTRRITCSTKCPCCAGADGCLHSDASSGPRGPIQARRTRAGRPTGFAMTTRSPGWPRRSTPRSSMPMKSTASPSSSTAGRLVRSLRHLFLDPVRARVSALYRPTCAVWCTLLSIHVFLLLFGIGVCVWCALFDWCLRSDLFSSSGSVDPHHDHPILPGTSQPFVFAVGGCSDFGIAGWLLWVVAMGCYALGAVPKSLLLFCCCFFGSVSSRALPPTLARTLVFF